MINGVPIPAMMKHLKLNPRGYPIPHGVLTDEDGVAHFAINDEAIRIRSLTRGLCSICGKKLFRGRWLIGGPMAALHEYGAFIDPPMHNECAHYALKVCPYLAAPRYAREVGLAKAEQAKAKGVLHQSVVESTMLPGRPEGDLFIALMHTGKLEIMENKNYRPIGPFARIEFWKHGAQLSDEEGWSFIDKTYTTENIAEIERKAIAHQQNEWRPQQ